MTDKTTSNDVPQNGPAAAPAEKQRTRRTGPHVYRAINAVKLRLDKFGGITKDRKTDYGDKYAFRGIDDMYNVLCGITADEGLVMIPRVIDSRIEREARANDSSKSQTHVWLTVEVDFISDVDGSKHTGCYVGEAIDTSDKASNKAISAAFKYACITVLQIPTHGESDDTENYNYEAASHGAREPAPARQERTQPQEAPPRLTADDRAAAKTAIENVRVAEKVSTIDTFVGLLTIFTDQQPPKKEFTEKVVARAMSLCQQAPHIKALQEARGLITALGQPQALMDVYNGRYMALRQIGGNEQEGGS